jgi:predicted Zn-dependent protease
VQRAQFEILPPSETATVRASLAVLLEPAVLSEYPRNTVVLFRAAFLYHDGLYHDARRELLAGLMADPDEPTLHFLLGKVYNRIGLRALAEKEFKEAEVVSTR